MAKNYVIRARTSRAEFDALLAIARQAGYSNMSQTLRAVVASEARRRGVWPMGGTHAQKRAA